MSKIPDEKECIAILKEAGCSPRIIHHSRTVKVVAEIIASKIPDARKELVIAGALLHDIGRAKDHTIRHAAIGAQMAEEIGISKEVTEIIRRHTGAGLDENDIDNFDLPPGDYYPRTIEQKIVAQADNLVSDSTVVSHRVPVEKLIAKNAFAGAERVVELHEELSDMAGFDLDQIVEIIGIAPLGEPPRRRRDQEKS